MYVQIALFFLDQMIKMEPNAGPTERESEEEQKKITNTPPHQHTTADTFALSTHVKYEVEPSATHWILSKIYVNLIINMRVVSKW